MYGSLQNVVVVVDESSENSCNEGKYFKQLHTACFKKSFCMF